MNSFELNKILGAILGTCLITLALNIAAGAIFAPEKPVTPMALAPALWAAELKSTSTLGRWWCTRGPSFTCT